MKIKLKKKLWAILTVPAFCILLIFGSGGDIMRRNARMSDAAGVTDGADTADDADNADDADVADAGKEDMACLEDGCYVPDKFGFSGGTGRVKLNCPEISVRDGRAYASLVFDSGSYSYVRVDGRTYEGINTEDTSAFEIPVRLNQNNTVVGCTTKMSAAHEITYTIFVYMEALTEESGEDDGRAKPEEFAEDDGQSSSKLNDAETEIAGLTFVEETAAEYAEYYKIYHYEGGITCVETNFPTDDNKTLRYLVVPSDAGIPAGLEHEMTVIRRPAKKDGEGAFHAYIASLPVLEWMEASGRWENLALTGIDDEDCQIGDVKNLLKEGKAVFGGTYDDIEYKTLVRERCDLAVVPSEILLPENEEAAGKYAKIPEYCEELGIPLFVDLASAERTKEGQDEWRKVYEIIFG